MAKFEHNGEDDGLPAWFSRTVALTDETDGGTLGENPRALEYEDGIVWTEDIESFDYVRQSVELSVSTRRQPVPWSGHGRRVGYAVLRPDAPSGDVPGKFMRRVFWVKNHDRSEQPNGTYKRSAPSEAVDPQTVAPGVWGELTARAEGVPSSDA